MAKKEQIEGLVSLFEKEYGEIPEVKALTNGGSRREYFRLKAATRSVIGVINEDTEENDIFISLTSSLRDSEINAPQIIKVGDKRSIYLIEDLGDRQLLELLNGDDKLDLAKKALIELLKIQLLPEKKWIKSVGFAPFSGRLIKWDLNYFKYDLLKPAYISFDEEKLENDFEKLEKALLSKENILGLMYRDFQSRNIMVKDEDLWFIDFQGARNGPVVYDAVSFIWQAKAPFSYEERESLVEYYTGLLSERTGVDSKKILKQFEVFEVFRTLQVLGAYGFRGLIEKKKHFLDSLPLGAANLSYLKEKGRLNSFPEIQRIAVELCQKFPILEPVHENGLTVRVFSFSYKKGYPEDLSGNGGGFIFDCRGLDNPGRYEEYKSLTGRDSEVIEFLEGKEGVEEFISNSFKIAVPTIENYIERGFTSLLVGFGCTGGQHRSVYCAERFSRLLKKKFPEVTVKIIHREQHIRETLEN